MFSPSNIWSKLIERPQARKNTLKLPSSNYFYRFSHTQSRFGLIQQANAMISKSLGKLHKLRKQGEDTSGNRYQSLE